MAVEDSKIPEADTPSTEPSLPETEAPAPEPAKDVTDEEPVTPTPAEESKALAVSEKAPGAEPEPAAEKSSEGSVSRDAILARVEREKRLSLITAWEESEKSKAEHKAHKKLSAIDSWEKSQKASTEAELKKIEEHLEKKKAEYAEKMKNKVALIHKEAEEKRAMIEAKKGEDILKAEELAAKYRARGSAPKKFMGFFSILKP